MTVTLWTARAAVLLYAASLGLSLRGRRRAARICWVAGAAVFLAHVAAAFAEVHHGSHADAVEHTARVTGEAVGVFTGVGLYFNYLFTAVWAIDAARWCRHLDRRAGWALHGFMAFMAFNAVVVFADGPTRWAGVVVCFVLLGAGTANIRHRRTGSPAAPQ